LKLPREFLQKPIVIALVGWAALMLYVCLGLALLPLERMTDDAEHFSHWTSTGFRYASSPIDLSVISPFQGPGGLVQPLGVWINPARLVTHLFRARDPRVLSFVVVILAVSIAI